MAATFDERSDLIWLDGSSSRRPTARSACSSTACIMRVACSKANAPMAARFQAQSAFRAAEKLGRILDFDIPYSVAEIDAAKRLVPEKNNQKEAYVRPIAWRGSEALGVSAQNNKSISPSPPGNGRLFRPGAALKGIRLDLADYRRRSEDAPCLAKAAGLT